MSAKLVSTDRPIALYYAILSEVDSIDEVDSSHRRVNFNNADWKLIDTTMGTIDLQETPGKTKSGTLFNNDLQATIPGHDDSTPYDIAFLSGRNILIRADYRNGMKKLIGNLDNAPIVYIKTLSSNSTKRQLQSNYQSLNPNYWLA